MTRVYAEPVDVRRRDDDPAEFVWRGRLYVVRAVVARWCEAGSWWRARTAVAVSAGDTLEMTGGALPGPPPPLDDCERDYWRVEAAAGKQAGIGVYDLCFSWSAGAWTLARALD